MTKNTFRNWDRRVSFLSAGPDSQIAGRAPDRGNWGAGQGRFDPFGPKWVETPTDPHVKRGGPGHLKGGRTNHATAADARFV
jgi:hypothetical protein